MKTNNNEFTLWIGILALIGVFIFFMPDIERLVFGRAKKMNIKVEEKEEVKTETKKETKTETKTTKTTTSKKSTYECTVSKKESFYQQDEIIKYVFDKDGNTLTYNANITVKVDNVNSYNQMKTTYQGTETTFNNLGEEFKKYYVINNNYDDNSKTIKLVTDVSDYSKALQALNDYNSKNQNSQVNMGVYKNYTEAEINMKSDGYTCKLS